MKGHVKRTLEVLEALGFTREDDMFGRRKWTFHHSFAPDEQLKVWEGQSEAACIAVQQKAHAISETGSSGPSMPKTVGRRKHRVKAASSGRPSWNLLDRTVKPRARNGTLHGSRRATIARSSR
ncbi:Uncharacterised protein [Mycobacteroides abscessus subsp. abscessus]|uniref:hypothetical protein n=1 Tax=Mycobacteroides abscessus TaxID=36809 RepID=UPI0009292679|nr:hypothetical protein [Mycobacteroides abscessus]SIH90144.1 Uncharacterised protein [Mycobacteroides abscessus subsp. abscessus]SIJ43287.1 Uncharacterised protein [Mycobacteroides abscessus subsp. abscessus]